MLVGAVTGVEHRDAAGEFGRQARRAFLRMTHDDGVDVGANHRDGVGQRFAFLAERGVAAVGKTHYRSAQTVHRGFKRQAGTGRGFKEAAGDHLVF
ncbi:hypothetical protein D3C76_1476850 [compost metagenome]